MRFVGGEAQAAFVDRIRGEDPESCLVVPVDVGKRRAEALVADVYGQVLEAPFGFALNEPGVAELDRRVDAAADARSASVCRVGIEACGHYHRLLMWRLVADGREVVELNPGHVKDARGQQGRRRVKTDATDLAAMASLLARGGGRPPQRRSDGLAVQRIWVAARARTVAARSALANQIQGLADQLFPSLTDCYYSLMQAKSAQVILAEICDPDRIRRLGPSRLRRFVGNRGVTMTRPKAAEIVAAARSTLTLPQTDREALQQVLTADMARYRQLSQVADQARQQLEDTLADTPAGVLTSLPGVSTIRASNYGAALGDPDRYPDAGAAYRTSGLAPATYESAGSSADGQPISREGRRTLRQAIIELGRGLAHHDEDFAAYRRQLADRDKHPKVVTIAVGRRAHRLAFAMMRDQTLYDPAAWQAGVAAGRSVMDGESPARFDVTAPPTSSMTNRNEEHNHTPEPVAV